MDHDRCARLGEDAPHRVQQRVVEVEGPHLQVQLEHRDAVVDEPGHVHAGRGLGVERGRPQHLGHLLGELRGPVVEEARDARLVCVGQGREPSHPGLAQERRPLLQAAAVGDRPVPPDELATGVELPPHRTFDGWRQEVGVHVDQPGQAESAPEGPDGARAPSIEGVGDDRVSHACP